MVLELTIIAQAHHAQFTETSFVVRTLFHVLIVEIFALRVTIAMFVLAADFRTRTFRLVESAHWQPVWVVFV